MKYCKFCGNEIEEGQECSCPESIQNREDLKKKINIAIIAGAAALAIIVAVIICLALFGGKDKPSPDPSIPSTGETPAVPGNDNNEQTSANKIDPLDYLSEPEISGANGKATFSVYLKEDEFARYLAGPEPEILNDEMISEWLSAYYLYSQYVNEITVEISKETGLSNGDKVTVTIGIPPELRDKIKNAEKAYPISGLLETKIYDFFGNIDVEYNGVSGNVIANVVRKDDSDVMTDCLFEISPQYYLSENDEITVSITNADVLEELYSVEPLELSRTYTVPKLATYAVSASQLPLSVIQGLAEQFYADRLEALQSDKDFEYKNVEYYGTYFYVSKGSNSNLNAPYNNILKIEVSYEMYLWGTSHGIRHDCLYFTNILVNADGTVSLTYEDNTNYIKSFNEDYYNATPITLDWPKA